MYMHAGCCEPPDCFGCFPPRDQPENIQLDGSGFDWEMPEDQTDIEAPLYNRFIPGLPAESTTTHYTRSRSLSLLNGTKQLRLNPSGACQWLWSDVRTVATVMKDGLFNFDPQLEETVYEPLNATDPTNPWNRVILPVTDARCGTSFWQCVNSNVTGYGVSALLAPAKITVTNPALGYFDFDDAGEWHWLLTISNAIARSAINYYVGVVAEQLSYHVASAMVSRVTPNGYTMKSAFDMRNTASGVSSIPPYRYGLSGFFPRGGGVLHYIRPLDCDTDFEGDPLTLTYAARALTFENRVVFFDVSHPANVQVTV